MYVCMGVTWQSHLSYMCVGTAGLDMAMDRCLYPLVPHGDSQGWTQDFGGKLEQEYFSELLVYIAGLHEKYMYSLIHKYVPIINLINCIWWLFLQGYARRAESLRRALQSPVWSVRVPPQLRFDSVVQDYCACHAIKPDSKLLCEAVIVAVDHGKPISLMIFTTETTPQ